MRDMTEGSISRHLLAYAVPMIAGNILQLTYNAVDSVIIGKYLGEDALAAVGTANPVMTIMILGASGVSIGASVLISKFYGARDEKRLKKELSSTVIVGVFFSLLVFLAGYLLAGNILRWIHTPAAILPQARTYLRTIFFGFLFTFQYNVLSSALRGIGDSKTPVIFLALSCCVNVLLDLLFVGKCGMGVRGAGCATIVAEAISVLCCVAYICRYVPLLRLGRGEFVVDRRLLLETGKIGSLTALQQAAQPVGKVIIQSVINTQGVMAIGAFNAVCRIDDFACIPSQSIGSAITSCTAQNRGAGHRKRTEQAFHVGMIIALAYFPIICGLTLLLKRPAVALLTPAGSEMIQIGVAYLKIKAWFFIMPCINNAIQGYFRGMEKMHIVLFCTVLQITIRTICVYLLVPKIGISGEAWGCFAGWISQAVFELIYYLHFRKKYLQRKA